MNAAYRIAWQDGSRVIFAAVEVAVDRCTLTESTLDVPAGTNVAWEAGARFATELFKESFGQERGRGELCVTILRLETQPVDSTVSAVAYVVFHAVCRALSVDPGRKFSFDEEHGTFSISAF